MNDVKRDEWMRLMTEIASLDRDKYRELRADAWKRVANSHETQTAEQRAMWMGSAS